jgi:large conductance mechanosensitive channel
MQRLEDSNEALLRVRQRVGQQVHRFWDGFTNFALRDNVLEVAVAFMSYPLLPRPSGLC